MFQLKIIVSVFFFFLLSGCAANKKQIKLVMPDTNVDETMVAGMTHIPQPPFGFHLVRVVNDVNGLQANVRIVYQAKTMRLSFQDVKQYYQADMEMLGWDFVNQFQDEQEILLVFKRPGNMLCQVRLDSKNILTVTVLG
jgi:hypothetical protein